MKYRRIFTIVIDSFGIGAMDNAADYGDVGCDTFGHIADKVPEIKIPNLIRMGLTQLHPAPRGWMKLCQSHTNKIRDLNLRHLVCDMTKSITSNISIISCVIHGTDSK